MAHGKQILLMSNSQNATVTFNFGPTMRFPPEGLGTKMLPMSDRVEEMTIEQSLSDVMFLAMFNYDKYVRKRELRHKQQWQ